MSDTLRVGMVAEGFTDPIIIQAAVESMLGERRFVLVPIQPESSLAFETPGSAGQLGGGWKGVYKWCCQTVVRAGGHLRNDVILDLYDILIFHLDADVASENPDEYLPELSYQLPCDLPCPPASDTVNALRAVLLSWLGETEVPARTVLCIPSKSTEAWVVTALFPDDSTMRRLGPECLPDPAARLSQQKLDVRISKSQDDYRAKSESIRQNWPVVTSVLPEAFRFQAEFLAALT